MWQNIVTKAQELIKYAEGLKDKTGPEKKAFVVNGMCNAIDVPFVPNWVEGLFEPILYGAVVDAVVKWWNKLTDHKLEEITTTPVTAAAMADMVRAGMTDVDVDAKYLALLEKYNVGQ